MHRLEQNKNVEELREQIRWSIKVPWNLIIGILAVLGSLASIIAVLFREKGIDVIRSFFNDKIIIFTVLNFTLIITLLLATAYVAVYNARRWRKGLLKAVDLLTNQGITYTPHIRAIYSSRRELPAGKHFLDLLSRTERTLFISGFSLNFVIGQSLNAVFELLREKPRVKVKLLLFDPSSTHLGFVAQFANKTKDSLRNEIKANLHSLFNRMTTELDKGTKNRIEVRIHNAPPLFSLTMVDVETDNGIILLELLYYKSDTDDRSSLEITSGSALYKNYILSFERLWNDAIEFKLGNN